MYEFATAVLLGLALYTIVNLVRHVSEVTRGLRIFLCLGFGALATWVTDYSMFAGWGVHFRSLWMGPVATGLVVGGIAALWHDAVGLITSYARRSFDEATEIERRIGDRAA